MVAIRMRESAHLRESHLEISIVYHYGHTPPAIELARINCAYSPLTIRYVAIQANMPDPSIMLLIMSNRRVTLP